MLYREHCLNATISVIDTGEACLPWPQLNHLGGDLYHSSTATGAGHPDKSIVWGCVLNEGSGLKVNTQLFYLEQYIGQEGLCTDDIIQRPQSEGGNNITRLRERKENEMGKREERERDGEIKDG